jgi:hypothetical protein
MPTLDRIGERPKEPPPEDWASLAQVGATPSPFPEPPPSRADAAYQTSIDRWKQLASDVFFAPVSYLNAPPWEQAMGLMGGIGKVPGPMARAPATAAPKATERIQSSAVQLGGKTYTGATHADAMESAARDTGKSIDQLWELRSEASGRGLQPDGFVTDAGRFVTRKEATSIANQANQVDKTRSHYIEGKHLTSEYLKKWGS